MFRKPSVSVLAFVLWLLLPVAGSWAQDPSEIAEAPAGGERAQTTDLFLFDCGTGGELLNYYEFAHNPALTSTALTADWITSCRLVGNRGSWGALARGTLTPAGLYARENWYSGGDIVQNDDLAYLLNYYMAGLGYVFSGGLEPYLGYWGASSKQTRKNFSPAFLSQPNLVSVERVQSEGLVLGLQGTYHRSGARSLAHFYGDFIVPIDASVRNSAFPGTTIRSSWGIGFEAGGSYGKTFGEASRKVIVGFQVNFIALYYDGGQANGPGSGSVEWPSNLTIGWSALLQVGGGGFSLLEK